MAQHRGQREWIESDEWGDFSFLHLCELFDLDPDALRQRVLGESGSQVKVRGRRLWDDAERELMLSMRQTHTTVEIAEHLQRTVKAVRSELERLAAAERAAA